MLKRMISTGFAGFLLMFFLNAVPFASKAAAASVHSSLTWGSPSMCSTCHRDSATQVHASVHYQWKGQATDMVNGPFFQGKYAALQTEPNYSSAMNAY